MDVIRIFKSISMYILIFLLLINIALYIQNKNVSDEVNAIEKENLELKKENEYMEERVNLFSPTGREEHYNSLTEDAETFVQSAYVQKVDGYQKRREKAKGIMSKELLDRFFPSDTTYQDQIETTIKNEQFFIEKLEPDQKNIEVIVTFNHELKYIQTGNVDESVIYASITFEKKDNHWIATNIKDIDAATRTTIDEGNQNE